MDIIKCILGICEGTESEWQTIPIPIPENTLVHATDTNVIKKGNGIDLWDTLPIFINVNQLNFIINYLTIFPDMSVLPKEKDMSIMTDVTGTHFVLKRDPPAGASFLWWTDVPPPGYLELNGAWLSKTTYVDLYAVLGDRYGIYSATHFKLPDTRGLFLRGFAHGSTNDPDRFTRTDRGDNTSGDNIGTLQSDQIKLHLHNVIADTGTYIGGYNNRRIRTQSSSRYRNDELIEAFGGNETRPINIYTMIIIKY
jgi:microcystin-dependent protein